VHFAEDPGSRYHYGKDANDRCGRSRTRITGLRQDRFNEFAAGRTYKLAELVADCGAGCILPKRNSYDRNDDEKNRRQRRRSIEGDRPAPAQGVVGEKA
jgi:hypothetical protein